MAGMHGTSEKRGQKKLKSRQNVKVAPGAIADDDGHFATELSRRLHTDNGMKRMCPFEARHDQRIQGNYPDGTIRETDEEVEKKIAFCCNICHCPQRIKDEYGDDQNVQVSEDGRLYHRRCCHRTPKGSIPAEWLPEVALVKAAAECALVNEKRSGSITYDSYQQITKSRDKIGKALNIPVQDKEIPSTERIEVVKNEMRNHDVQPLLADKMRSNHATGYSIIEKQFNQRLENTTTKRGAAVLDLFGGIGTGVVCLKRLQIEIDKLVHVEHCQVANVVYLDNHGPPDDKAHVVVPKFKDFEKHLERYMTQHGPFDIVIAGPPVDYAAINENREGATGLQGSYLAKTGDIIRRIREHNEQVGHPYPFFVVENAILTEEDQRSVKEAFWGTDAVWYQKDPRDITPFQQNRTYLSNIPLIVQEKLTDLPPRMCFDDDFDDVGVAAREMLMGFSAGYVSEPIRELFQNVKQALFEDGKDWRCQTPMKYHHFAGDYHDFKGEYRPYRFYIQWFGDTPQCCIKMAPRLPCESAKDKAKSELPIEVNKRRRGARTKYEPEYYTEEQFAKRLLANSFSIPTVEWFLSPLSSVFSSKNYAKSRKRSAEALAKPSREKMEDVHRITMDVEEPDGTDVDVCDV